MKKSLFLSLFVIISILMITGCGNKKEVSNNTSENDNQTINTKLEKFNKVDINCNAIKEIRDISVYQGLFITQDGSLYQISYDKVFSNETNCKQIETGKSFNRFIKGGILDSNNDIYYYNDNEELVLYNLSMGSLIMPNNMIEKIPKELYSNIIYSNEDQKYGENEIYYFYYDSNKKEVYSYSSDLSEMSSQPIFSLDKDEEVEYITYGGIKTNKNFYQYRREPINKEECEKYADIKCELKNGFYVINDENITKNFEQIKFISYGEHSYYILDKNYNFYTNVMGG